MQAPLVTDGRRVHGLARQFLHVTHPTLVFPGLPMKVVPFPFVESQAAVIAKLWANDLPPLPLKGKGGSGNTTYFVGDDEEGGGEVVMSRDLLEKWWRDDEATRPGGRGFHVFPPLTDGHYINEVHRWLVGEGSTTATATKEEEQKEDGEKTINGNAKRRKLEPPFWDDEKMWNRSTTPQAKMKFESTGKKAMTFEELGFVYQPPN